MKEFEQDLSAALNSAVRNEEPSLDLKEKIFDRIGSEPKRFKIHKRPQLKYLVASLLITVVLLTVNPAFAKYLTEVPFVVNLVEMVKEDSILQQIMFNDEGLQEAVEHGYGTNIERIASDSGISFKIDNVISDQTRMIMTYSIKVDNKDYQDVEEYWFNNLKIMDDKGNSVVEIDDGSIKSDRELFRPLRIAGPAINSNIPGPKSENEKQWLGGYVEIMKTGKVQFPSKIITKIDGLIAGPFNPSNENKIVPGNWTVAFKVPESMANAEPIVYPGKKISIIQGDYDLKLQIDQIKIYPTKTALKIDVVERNNSPLGYLYKYHLEDEKGNTYKYLGSTMDTDSGNVEPNFESCYFTKPRKLYLIIETLTTYDKTADREKETEVNKKIRLF